MKRAIIYTRVSSDQQERNYSLPSQFEGCKAYLLAHGFELAAHLEDPGISGAIPINERAEGRKILPMLRAGQANALVAYRVDRYSRDLPDLLVTMRQIIDAGGEIHAVDVGKAKDENDIVWILGGWKGTQERTDIAERMARGRQYKAASGKVIGYSQPYGYRFSRDAMGKVIGLEIVQEEARIVVLIFTWYVRNGMKIRAITKALSEDKIPSPADLRKGGPASLKIRGRGNWCPSTVAKILASEIYKGIVRYHDTIASVPAIIPSDLWHRAQEIRAYNARMSSRNNKKRKYLLRGMVICGKCGIVTKSRGVGANRTYYRCRRSEIHPEAPCSNRTEVPGAKLEEEVWEEISSKFADLNKLRAHLFKAQKLELAQLQPKRESLEATVELLNRTERDAEQCARELRRAGDDETSATYKALKRQQAEIDAQYQGLQGKKTRLEAELAQQRITDQRIEDTLSYWETVQLGRENATFKDKRRVLELLDVKVYVLGKKHRISYSVPDGDFASNGFETSQARRCLAGARRA